ncbi:MAG: zinc-binding dehydrogenase [Planctomycetota bacterium]|jgi:2-desacetyl-2-hydroxyethyl bacteriochlorophyllide A dehydrogenase|nr:zinc-binding dehydrogenase [Planctomycetota bacterium]
MGQIVRAIVFTEPGHVALGTFELPEMQSHHLLIKTLYTFVSPGTECRVLMGHYGASGNFPLIPGYACVGEIIAVGTDVTGYRVGDRVSYCPDIDDELIPQGIHSHWGGQVSHHLLPVTSEPVLLPADADPLAYAPAQVAAISLRGVTAAQAQTGETAVVIGQGPIGAFSTAWLLARGCRVIVVDVSQSRLDRALANGATAAVDNSQANALERISAYLPQGGADIVIETAGISATVHLAHQLLRRTPRAFRDPIGEAIGRWPRLVYQANYLDTVSIDPWTYFDGEGVVVLTPMDRNTEDRMVCVEAIRTGAFAARGYIDRVVAVANAPEHYRLLRDEPDAAFSVVFNWQEDN